MHCFKKILFFIGFAFVSEFLIAQQAKNETIVDQYRAVHWGADEGLSQGITESILKDVNGFLWIGTEDGLNRFDGSNFRVYFHDPNKRGTIPGNYIVRLV